jgi:Fic family protein
MRREDLAPAVRGWLVRYPSPHANHFGVVPAPPPRSGVDIRPVLDRLQAASHAMGRLDALARALPDPWIASRVLLRQEAVKSSAIEGTWSTLDDLLTQEAAEDGTADSAVAQVRDYAHALEALLPEARARGPSVFTRDLIARLHECVVRADPDYPDAPGALRSNVVWIGGGGNIAYSTYNPAPPADVPRCLDDCLAYMRGDDPDPVPPSLLVRMAVAHAHFEAVHPFRDGNGRVGRLLLPLMMAAEGVHPVPLSPFIEAHKDRYHEALKAAQKRLDRAAMVGFVADAMVGTVTEILATQEALATLRLRWMGRRVFRAGSAARRVLDLLPHHPVVSVDGVARLLDVSFPAAATAVRQLGEAGILAERTGGRRNRVFAAAEVLSLLDRPFGEAPVLPPE